MCEAAFFVGVSREMAGEKMKQVLLVTGDQPTQEDVRPLESIHRIGLASLTVASQSEVLAAGEAFGGRDVVLLAPSCDRPELLDWCERWKPQRLVVGSDGDFGASSGQLARIRRGGTFVLGPGSRGVLDPLQDLFVSWTPAVQPSAALDGNVALIGQGGAVVFSLFDMALEAGVKFRQVVSLGVCQDDGALLECLDQCAEDGQTRLVVLCAESFVQGRRVMERAARLVRQGVPVVLLRCGVFPGIDRRARLRHPDGNWADDATWRAVAERYGVTLLSDVGELLAFAKLYGCSRPAQGLSIAGLASSVGLALLLRDSCFRAGVALGGAYYAMTRDIALRPAPVTFEEAQEMISSLKGASLITGSWSGVPLASDELARTIAQMSVMGDCEPDLELLDINPIFVRPNAAEIADAFIRRTERSRQ